jgi:hypothetical protein
MVLHHEVVAVPFELWLVATVTLFSTPLLTWLTVKATIKGGFWQITALMVTSQALNHIITFSAFRTLLTGNAKWTRTNKFKSKTSIGGALLAARDELGLGLATVAFAATMFALLPYTGLALMFMIGLLYSSMKYLSAPIVSLINVLSMKRAERRDLAQRGMLPGSPLQS